MKKIFLITSLSLLQSAAGAAAVIPAGQAAFELSLRPAAQIAPPGVSAPLLSQITGDFPLVFARSSGKLTVGINPNRELLYTILHLSAYADKLRNGRTHPIAAAALAKLGAFSGHPAVAELEAAGSLNWKKGFCYDAFSEFPGYFSALPEGRRIHDYNEDFLARVLRGMPREEKIKYLDAYWERVMDFYRVSGYEGFFRANADLYKSYVDAVYARLPASDPAKLHEDYHGLRDFENFYVVPSPLNLPPGGSFGGRIGKSVFNFMGYGYKEADSVKFLILHEFGHSFCNPAVTAHLTEAAAYGGLMQGLAAEMGAQAYSGWSTVMYELLVRSVHARLTLKTEGAQAAELFLLREERVHKFVFIRDFYDQLAVYESERAAYPTLAEFYPRLLKTLGNWRLAEVEEALPSGLWTSAAADGVYIDWADPKEYAWAAGLREGDTVTAVNGARPAASFFLSVEPGTYSLAVARKDGGEETLAFTVPGRRALRPVRDGQSFQQRIK